MTRDAETLARRLMRRIGRLIEPLFAPDAEACRRRDERLMMLVKDQRGAIRKLTDQAAAQRSAIDRALGQRAADMTAIGDRLAELRSGVRRQAATLGRLVRHSGLDAQLELTEQRVIDRLDRLRRTDRPIIVGPWTGEIGFELMYWIPFVRWASEKFGLAADRLVVVSRGGTSSWYGGMAARYVDVFSLVTLDEFRSSTESVKKQRVMGAFDRALLRRVRDQLDGGHVAVLHPALMYALFMPFWKHQAALPRVIQHSSYRRIRAAALPAELPALPSRYVAVRFYFSSCFPDTPGNRAFVSSVVSALAEHTDVVMLNPGIRVDDHVDYMAPDRSRIHYIDMSARPQHNLAWQTAIIGGAEAFVGTYGGFAYLAPFCGVNALAFYSERTYFVYHLELAQRAFASVQGGTLEAIHVQNAELLRAMLGAAKTAGSRQ